MVAEKHGGRNNSRAMKSTPTKPSSHMEGSLHPASDASAGTLCEARNKALTQKL